MAIHSAIKPIQNVIINPLSNQCATFICIINFIDLLKVTIVLKLISGAKPRFMLVNNHQWTHSYHFDNLPSFLSSPNFLVNTIDNRTQFVQNLHLLDTTHHKPTPFIMLVSNHQGTHSYHFDNLPLLSFFSKLFSQHQ